MHRTSRTPALASVALLVCALVSLTGCDATTSAGPSAALTPSASPTSEPDPTTPAPVTSSSPSPSAPGGDDGAVDPGAPAPAPPAGVAVTLTFAGWNATTASVEAGGYVSGVIENGGTCSLRLVREGTIVEVAGTAAADAATTTCDMLSVPVDRVSSGTWTAELTYTSTGATGTSAPMEVQVP